ncbi:hypothetical protein SDC9_126435 [bioreactor metagenome]|uniref:Uncharacterized protein n=1 Tax=bioreactor metagenome TaxID=1076179 RepID=A0A645CRR7_9ZZZZ
MSSIYIIAISVLDRTPAWLGSTFSLVSLILLLTRAVLNLIVSVNPSLEPLITVSPEGSPIPLLGHDLFAIVRAAPKSSIKTRDSPASTAFTPSFSLVIFFISEIAIILSISCSGVIFSPLSINGSNKKSLSKVLSAIPSI